MRTSRINPQMSRDLFQEFWRLKPSLPQQSSYVFVPVSPPAPDLYFVGQATGGMLYDDDVDYEGTAERCRSYLKNLTSQSPSVPLRGFWKSIERISNQVRLITMREPRIGWSNLCKVGATEGNPGPHAINAQASLCVQALQQELARAKPKVTVFLTSNYAQEEILLPAVGHDGWRNNVPSEDRIAVKLHKDFGALLWGYHPVGPMGRQHGTELEAFIAGFASAHLADDSDSA